MVIFCSRHTSTPCQHITGIGQSARGMRHCRAPVRLPGCASLTVLPVLKGLRERDLLPWLGRWPSTRGIVCANDASRPSPTGSTSCQVTSPPTPTWIRAGADRRAAPAGSGRRSSRRCVSVTGRGRAGSRRRRRSTGGDGLAYRQGLADGRHRPCGTAPVATTVLMRGSPNTSGQLAGVLRSARRSTPASTGAAAAVRHDSRPGSCSSGR